MLHDAVDPNRRNLIERCDMQGKGRISVPTPI